MWVSSRVSRLVTRLSGARRQPPAATRLRARSLRTRGRPALTRGKSQGGGAAHASPFDSAEEGKAESLSPPLTQGWGNVYTALRALAGFLDTKACLALDARNLCVQRMSLPLLLFAVMAGALFPGMAAGRLWAGPSPRYGLDPECACMFSVFGASGLRPAGRMGNEPRLSTAGPLDQHWRKDARDEQTRPPLEGIILRDLRCLPRAPHE